MQGVINNERMIAMNLPIEVSCQCGQVSYTLTQAPNMVLACHCKECQKLSTAPLSVTAVVPAAAVEFRGEMGEFRRIAESGNTNVARFCKGCGNRVYHFNPDKPDEVKLKLKPTDAAHASLFEPKLHVWVKEKPAWYTVPEGVPAYNAGT